MTRFSSAAAVPIPRSGKGAALNAVQIAELLPARAPARKKRALETV